MRLTEHLNRLLGEKLAAHRIVVWYDSEGVFAGYVAGFQAPHCQVVSVTPSALLARRQAEEVYRRMEESARPAEAQANLLIYLPRKRASGEQRTQDPFEIFAVAGVVFGEDESERLPSLARAAMPDLVERIDGLFLSGQPTFKLLDGLKQANLYPLVQQALNTQSTVDVCVALLGSKTAFAQVNGVSGAHNELLRLLQVEIGFRPANGGKPLGEQLANYVLLSELAFDLGSAWPDSLSNAPRAEFKHRDLIYTICDRLRGADNTREAYMALAERIERELRLPEQFADPAQLGSRDTFAFEERRYLAQLAESAQAGDLIHAREILEARHKSVWQHQAERAQVWQLAERCVNLLETAARLVLSQGKLAALVAAYTDENGWRDLDRQQRLMEQSYADCTEPDEVLALVELARRCYREAIDRLQERFLQRVQTEGWPPEGLLRQTQVFDRFVAPLLERRERVAYILADSLRFEMGGALAEQLAPLGEIVVQPAAATLPTITQVGMAALLPGADGALSLRAVEDGCVPHIGDRPLKDSGARMAYLAEKYGDRFAHVALGDWLDYPEKKRSALAMKADLLVLRVTDIDEMGEHISLRQARKYMSDLLGDLKNTAVQLARLGYQAIIIAADHGHVLLPEVQPGDTARVPEGQWAINKRRSQLGARLKEQPGTLLFKSSFLGIQTDAPDYCVPTGFGVYATDASYFHEGLSLQECIIPVVSLRPSGKPGGSARQQQIEIRYKSSRFTSQVIGTRVYYSSLLAEPLRVRVEAYDVGDPKGSPIGEAADCAARDETTHEVILQPNVESEVPVLISPDFKGAAVEIRALSPDRMVVWARLRLKNGVLD